MMHARYFDTARKGNDSTTVPPTVVGGRRFLTSEMCIQSDPPPFKKCWLLLISAYNVSTVRDSKKKFKYDEYKVDHGLSNKL